METQTLLGLVKFDGKLYSINGVDKESTLTVKVWSNSAVLKAGAKANAIIALWVANEEHVVKIIL